MSELTDEERLRNLPLRSEEIGFAPDEMIACARCGKPNAPTRSGCLYCGAEIVGTSIGNLADLRPLESWEQGINIVIRKLPADHEQVASRIASILSAETAVIESILASGRPIPIARVESDADAALVSEKLGELGVGTSQIADNLLHPNSPPVRLRKVAFAEHAFVLTPFNPAPDVHLQFNDLALIVVGTLLEERVETIEKRRSSRTIRETQTSSDARVVDIYSKQDSIGWRISSSGFDFTALGANKSMLAGENMNRLIEAMRQRSPSAVVSTDFDRSRALLEHCWPSESRRDSLGVQRAGFAQKGAASISISSNANQLLKYSRLQWHLL